MQTLIPSPSSPSPGGNEPKFQNPNPTSSPSPSPSPASMRLWRPSAQRNLRNQWSKLLSYRQRWASASSDGRSHATCIVNAHLSHRYMPDMDMGVLSGMSDIKQRAQEKLSRRQEHYRVKLLSSYKDMVGVVAQMVNASRSMRCFLKGSLNSPIVQFGSQPEDSNDTGDGGGVPVFSFLSIPYFESSAQELAQMFVQELALKRLLVLELLSINCEEDSSVQTNRLSWLDELYPGEFDDLSISDLLYSKEHCQPIPPRINGWEFGNPTTGRTNHLLDREVLQVQIHFAHTLMRNRNILNLRVSTVYYCFSCSRPLVCKARNGCNMPRNLLDRVILNFQLAAFKLTVDKKYGNSPYLTDERPKLGR